MNLFAVLMTLKQQESDPREVEDTSRFIIESTISTINDIIDGPDDPEKSNESLKDAEVKKLPEEEPKMDELTGPIQPDSETAMTICDIDRLLMPPPMTLSQIIDDKDTDDDGKHLSFTF